MYDNNKMCWIFDLYRTLMEIKIGKFLINVGQWAFQLYIMTNGWI